MWHMLIMESCLCSSFPCLLAYAMHPKHMPPVAVKHADGAPAGCSRLIAHSQPVTTSPVPGTVSQPVTASQ
jgi:hypothetical protein